MNNYGNDRKALYRRLFKYAEHRDSRAKMLSYLFNRLKNNQLRDVLDLLDQDPECAPPPRALRPCKDERYCTDPLCKVHGIWREK